MTTNTKEWVASITIVLGFFLFPACMLFVAGIWWPLIGLSIAILLGMTFGRLKRKGWNDDN